VAGLALSLVGRIFEKAAGLRVLLLGAGETALKGAFAQAAYKAS
jgi:glutamyl-tRNA reductase